MSSEISYDPVTVLDEKEAVGSIADIFQDIIDTMNIPLVTSIWRGLAGMENSLAETWLMAKPIYKNEINQNTSDLIRQVNRIAAPNGVNSNVATLWRHLAHWPSFLQLIHEKLMLLNNDNTIKISITNTSKQLNVNGLNLNYKETFENNLSNQVYFTIKNYVNEETQVIRMVVIGKIIEQWIKNQKYLKKC